ETSAGPHRSSYDRRNDAPDEKTARSAARLVGARRKQFAREGRLVCRLAGFSLYVRSLIESYRRLVDPLSLGGGAPTAERFPAIPFFHFGLSLLVGQRLLLHLLAKIPRRGAFATGVGLSRTTPGVGDHQYFDNFTRTVLATLGTACRTIALAPMHSPLNR